MALTVLMPQAIVPVSAAGGGDRTLWMHHTHTGQTGRFTYMRNGKYDKNVLRDMNVFLADWRTKEPTNMDPALFDLLWKIYGAVDGKQPINIVSSYRSPKTNAMLASNSSGVADNSQHMKGKAMDMFIPGVNLSKLREAAMRYQVGGVGYYPTSGSPFVHVDTGNVRAWPRMTRAQLKKVFPDGKTLHLPTDGKPLSQQGRAYAEAEWKKCKTVPCNGQVSFASAPEVQVAAVDDGKAPVPAIRPRELRSDASFMLASLEEPAQRVVSTVTVAAPLPTERVAAGAPASTDAPFPALKSNRLVLATRSALPSDDGQTALSALAAIDQPIPRPRTLMTAAPDEMVTAYAPAAGSERVMRQLIEQQTEVALLPKPDASPHLKLLDGMQTASLGGADLGRAASGLFEATFAALGAPLAADDRMASALAELALSRKADASLLPRDRVALVPPEIDHVNETLVHPVPMDGEFWAVLSEAEGYLDKTTELGPLTGRVGFVDKNSVIPSYDRFVASSPQLVAGI